MIYIGNGNSVNSIFLLTLNSGNAGIVTLPKTSLSPNGVFKIEGLLIICSGKYSSATMGLIMFILHPVSISNLIFGFSIWINGRAFTYALNAISGLVTLGILENFQFR